MKKMDETTRQNVINILLNQYHMRPQGGGQRYKYGICPACGKRDLWAFAHDPWTVQCDRESNCGYKQSMRELHPEAFATVTERALKQESSDPRVIAKTYLQEERGLNTTRCGEFQQATAFNPKNQKSSATVRFALPNGGYWERIIEDIDLPKALFSKNCPYKGCGWTSPEFDPKADEIWIVEGIFDALALQQNGINAISAMTCHNFPKKTLEEIYRDNPFATVVIALDSNKAGRVGTKKMAKEAENLGFKVRAALTNSNDDWNDKHIKKRLTADDIRTYKYYGALEIAKTPSKKALIMWARNGGSQGFWLEHGHKTYWCDINLESLRRAEAELTEEKLLATGAGDVTELREEELEEIREQAFTKSGSVFPIATCIIDFLYAEKSIVTDETQYYVKISNHRGSTMGTFNGRHIKSASEFGARIIDTLPGANFDGTPKQLGKIYDDKTFNITTVNTIDYIGYCPEAKAYIYPTFAVKNGKVYEKNEEDYFTIDGYSIKSTLNVARFTPALEYKNNWTRDFISAYGPQGLIVLTYFFGSLFAVQIRDKYKSFPFLEFTGEAGAGKTSVLDFCWLLMGRENYEGINPVTSTRVARMRTLRQFSNMPTVYLEGQGEEKDAKQGQAVWLSEAKQLFNGISPRATGVMNSGNETSDEPFYGSLIVSQNRKIYGEAAVLGRFIYLHMTRDHHTAEGRQASHRLNRLGVEELSGFLKFAVEHEKEVLTHHANVYEEYHSQIMSLEGINTERLADNHATLLAMLDSLCKLLNIDDYFKQKTREYIFKIAKEREADLDQDPEEVYEFWQLFEFLDNNTAAQVNHSTNDDLIAINLNSLAEIARNRGSALGDISTLRKLLPHSKRYKFIDNKNVYSRYEEKTMRCYVFKKEGR